MIDEIIARIAKQQAQAFDHRVVTMIKEYLGSRYTNLLTNELLEYCKANGYTTGIKIVGKFKTVELLKDGKKVASTTFSVPIYA